MSASPCGARGFDIFAENMQAKENAALITLAGFLPREMSELEQAAMQFSVDIGKYIKLRNMLLVKVCACVRIYSG
jgi:hypothetical protein